MKLTNRDKVLLYVLALFIILIVGVKFLILPIYQDYKESKVVAQEISMQAKSIEMAVNDLDSEKDSLKDTQNDFEKATKDYLKYMNIREITNYINNLTLEYGLITTSFSAEDTDNVLGEDAGLHIYSRSVTLEVTGTYENLRSFINSAYENKSLLISYFDMVTFVEPTMEIELMLFMYDTKWSE